MIGAGDLGRLVAVYVMYHIHHPEEVAARYPGVIRQILTHNTYVLLYLAGKPRQVSAMKATLHYDEIPQEGYCHGEHDDGKRSVSPFVCEFCCG